MILSPATIRLAHGYSRLPPARIVRVLLTRADLQTLPGAIEREADAPCAERRNAKAESLNTRAADLREAAR